MSSPYGPPGPPGPPTGGNPYGDPAGPWGSPPPAGYGAPTGYPPQPPHPYPPGGGYPPPPGYGPQPRPGQPPSGGPYPAGYPPQAGYGPGGPGVPPGFDDGGGKRSGLVWGAVAVSVLLVAAVVVGGFAWPGWWISKVFDSSRMESGVHKILTDNYKLDNVTDVSCPAGEEVAPGHTFHCTVKVGGERRTVKITVKDSDGTYEVSQPK